MGFRISVDWNSVYSSFEVREKFTEQRYAAASGETKGNEIFRE